MNIHSLQTLQQNMGKSLSLPLRSYNIQKQQALVKLNKLLMPWSTSVEVALLW